MSTKTPSTTSNASTTKAAAKKKAKKATKGPLNDSSAPAGAGGEIFDVGQEDTEQLFNFPPGAYPAEFSYESSEYFDEHPTPFSLPFPFDYGPQNGTFPAGINITNEDLVQTASELYRRMADPSFGNDDAYWSSLPPHLRQFIREAIPLSNTPGQKGPISEGQQGMWTMAQQIVSAASQGMGLGPEGGANLFRGVNGRAYGNGVAQELGFHRHPDAKEEYDDDDDFDLDEPYPSSNGEVAKKKKNKKKKKSGAVEPPPPPAPVKQPPRQTPQLNPPPPPSTPAPINPPPSSRAAGKQPMSSTNPPARSARAAGKAPASATPAHNHSHHNHAPKPVAKGKAPANVPPAKIWTQASVEDRENIRQFWLTLNEAERRDLLLIEKDTVLRKMKEQHRHMCGCAVCRRKKVNIESELDQLYEQYYDELSHYAMEQRAAANGLQAYPMGSGPFPGSVEVDATGQVTRPDHRAPDPKAMPPDDIIGDEGSEEYDDEEYDDEDDLEDEDDLGSEESDPNATEVPPPVQPPRQPKAPPKALAPRADLTSDFLTYGNALSTIKGERVTLGCADFRHPHCRRRPLAERRWQVCRDDGTTRRRSQRLGRQGS